MKSSSGIFLSEREKKHLLERLKTHNHNVLQTPLQSFQPWPDTAEEENIHSSSTFLMKH